MEEVNPNGCARSSCMVEKKARPEEQLSCPRCKSNNTKFCYYNNYSLTQPRHFCKSCRRYWTEGGSLRNVPVGGGSRKNRKSTISNSSSSSSSSSPSSTDHFHIYNPKFPNYPSQFSTQNAVASVCEAGKDLNLAFPAISHCAEVPKIENINCTNQRGCNQISALDLLRSGGLGTRGGLSSFIPNLMPDSNTNLDINPYPTGFSLPDEFKPTLGISVGSGRYGDGRNMLPFEELDHHSTLNEANQSERKEHSTGYWSGMLGGGPL